MTPASESVGGRLTIRVDEAARMLSVSPSTIRRLISSGVLSTVQLPGSMKTKLIRLSDLNKLVNGQTVVRDRFRRPGKLKK